MSSVFLAAETSKLDPVSFLPNLEKMLGYLELVMRIAVLAGPLCLLGLGLWYLLAPAKEANHFIGFRCYWGMASVEVWQFTQRLAGMVWTGIGLVLTIVMAVICNGYRELSPDVMVFSALKALGWELLIVVLSILVINVVIIVLFNKNGYRRSSIKR